MARLLKGGVGARVFCTTQGSYDPHFIQSQLHAELLREFAGASFSPG